MCYYIHNAANTYCRVSRKLNQLMLFTYSVFDSYKPRHSWSYKVNIDTSYIVSEYYYLAFIATYLSIDLPKSFQHHTAKCLLINSSSSQLTNIAVAMKT